MPPIPPNLTAKCPEFELAQSGEVDELLAVHAANMGRAGVCHQRHSDLADLLERLREEENAQ